jgi:nitrile hydratase
MHGAHHGDHGGHGGHGDPESERSLRGRALESLLVEKGLVPSDLTDQTIYAYEHDVRRQQGARVVARAWVDPAFKQRLLADGTAAVQELGVRGGLLQVVANTPTVHNLVVCTLCSCYPGALLGPTPGWYKSFAYRARAVLEPRAVLREFGLELDPAVEVRVWDSTSELRYMVLPERPAGTEALGEAELATLVTPDALIGVARADTPAAAA